MRRSIKVAKAFGALLVGLSTVGLIDSAGRYFLLAHDLEIIAAMAPLERDFVAQSVEPFVKDKPGGDSVLGMVKTRQEEVRALQQGWHLHAERTQQLMLVNAVFWGGALASCIGLFFALRSAPHDA